jgi:serine/threonine protein kinase
LVHQDISYSNILLESDNGCSKGLRRGLLINFEYAASRSKSHALAPGSHTVRILRSCHFNSLSVLQGTAPFMSIELLTEEGKIRHDTYHDLESLFFVLIYLCTNLSGPGTIRSQKELEVFSVIPLSSWFRASSNLFEVGLYKAGAMCKFRASILDFFAPYFDDLKPCMKQLFKAMYHKTPGHPARILHATMIDIFTNTLESLADETHTLPNFQPLQVDSIAPLRKRSLGIHDNGLVARQKKHKTVSLDPEVGSSAASSTSEGNWAGSCVGGSRGNSRSSRDKACCLRSSSRLSSQPASFPC